MTKFTLVYPDPKSFPEKLYISQLLGCDRNTVAQGMEEVTGLPPDSQPEDRVRQAGGGRKPIEVTHPDIDERFLTVLKHHTAGDPMDETVRWTNLTRQEIAEKLAEEYDIQVSEPVIGQLLKKHHYRRRKAQKKDP
ncbi:MAG: winged helix-turn-helix domain-containing protein [Deltaproteobacteria bacterium]|nr:winged helix-turn-helix domain-containing protein [Deltaproteobacteria bacterium]